MGILKSIGMIPLPASLLVGAYIRNTLNPGGTIEDMFSGFKDTHWWPGLVAFVVLTIVAFWINPDRFGYTRAQFRPIWIGAFLMGAIGGPLMIVSNGILF